MPAARSFRDPGGFCIALNGRILRVVEPDYVAQVEGFLNSPCARKFTAAGNLIPTRLLSKIEVSQWLKDPEFSAALDGCAIGAVFEHERVEFPSFPSEWPPEMLYAAAELTLNLACEALTCGYRLKDATPQNILFRGTTPVFVDLLSFEPRKHGESVWTPYAQFVRTFLLPLLANKYWNTSLAEVFTTRRDGLEPAELVARCTLFQKFRPPFLTLITLPTLLARKGEAAHGPRMDGNDEKALFVIEALFKRLRSILKRLKPKTRRAEGWSNYMDTHSYEREAFAAKESFVRAVMAQFKPKHVLDIGANTGHFGRIAATEAAQVLAVDSDPACAGESFARARSESLNMLPLVVDMARPTPALGWRNDECASFLDRARGQFDAVLMLAVLHHLLVTERVPLRDILDLAAELTRALLVIEFVPLEDPMFQRLLRGRGALFAHYNRAFFEESCQRQFEIVRETDLPGTERRLYLLRKK
ncbi:MAG TPA: class I SAM-dependent methyltransferase [Verrucomicrobiae bacterium]|nr:class I SAM-dependent methyltransferase [Verrucomicrobiae bacterium]